jgi:DNA-binding MarR family transcriptional regulator
MTVDERLSLELYAVTRRAYEGGSERTVHAIAGEHQSLSKLKLLHILARPHQRPPRITRIAVLLDVTGPQGTKVVSELERDRLVDRIDDEDDGRVKRVLITPKGRELLSRVDQAMIGHAQRWIGELSGEEREQLAKTLSLLARRPDVAQYLPGHDD